MAGQQTPQPKGEVGLLSPRGIMSAMVTPLIKESLMLLGIAAGSYIGPTAPMNPEQKKELTRLLRSNGVL